MSEIARQVRSRRQQWAAPGGRHDRVVAIAQMALPVATGVLAAFLVTAPLTRVGDVSFVLDKNRVAVAKERLRISKASYRGEDAKGQPFELQAGSAIQKSSTVPIVQLRDLAAKITLADGPATLRANHGSYDMDSDKIAIQGPVEFRGAGGYSLDTRNAVVNLKTRKLESGGAVQGTTPLGTFSADHMQANLADHTVTLNGNARLRIVPKRANRQP
ncbi:LPS export ABC transporter periplasmic protein LptC [Stakelama sediminis]|uniref:Lipopolysaccharide export system protein LptC n=1 Tax=Stakelama sediminis TaxID=463200 RepID=A0A840YXN5_9SPHN|nr:LPS export ABC transporter periplasmic protein LptC [Stakelama sediminis]MBB5718335.1 lipopolysaccharide export system protein LptC [Stakelama sediminis]